MQTTETAGNALTFRSNNVQYVSKDAFKSQVPMPQMVHQRNMNHSKTLEYRMSSEKKQNQTYDHEYNNVHEHVTFNANANEQQPAPIRVS